MVRRYKVLLAKQLSIFLLMVLAFGPSLYAQTALYTATNGKASFFSKAPLEDISAQHSAVSSVINTTTNTVEVRMAVNQFVFENDLMQEHFNDDFMESAKYPAAIFTGKINEAINWASPGSYNVSATGNLTLHGVSVLRTISGKLLISETGLTLESSFPIKLEDHKIKIPKLLFQKIAEQVTVNCLLTYVPYKK